jgi:hypothetical protein
VSAYRDKNPGNEWSEIPAETPYLALCGKRAVCKDWMVEVVGLKLVTQHPVIEPVSATEPGTEICDAETDAQRLFYFEHTRFERSDIVRTAFYRAVPTGALFRVLARGRLSWRPRLFQDCEWPNSASTRNLGTSPIPSNIMMNGPRFQ